MHESVHFENYAASSPRKKNEWQLGKEKCELENPTIFSLKNPFFRLVIFAFFTEKLKKSVFCFRYYEERKSLEHFFG